MRGAIVCLVFNRVFCFVLFFISFCFFFLISIHRFHFEKVFSGWMWDTCAVQVINNVFHRGPMKGSFTATFTRISNRKRLFFISPCRLFTGFNIRVKFIPKTLLKMPLLSVNTTRKYLMSMLKLNRQQIHQPIRLFSQNATKNATF